MGNFKKNVTSVAIGAIIATFVITGLIWYINRLLFKQPPLVHHSDLHKKVENSSTKPEIIAPIDFNNTNSQSDVSKNEVEIERYNANMNQHIVELSDNKIDNEDVIGDLINTLHSSKSKATTNTFDYKVQIGSFKTHRAANKRREDLMIIDISSQIVTVNINGKEHYRVVTKPMSKKEADQIQINLKHKNIDSVILLQ